MRTASRPYRRLCCRRVLIAVGFMLSAASAASACDFGLPAVGEIDASLARQGETAPAAPRASLDEILRAPWGLLNRSSCRDVGRLVIAVDITDDPRDVYYRFSTTPDAPVELPTWPLLAGYGPPGKRAWLFPFIESKKASRRPLDFIVTVTAVSRSGVESGATEVRVVHPGRH